jgi:hypothetical protein
VASTEGGGDRRKYQAREGHRRLPPELFTISSTCSGVNGSTHGHMILNVEALAKPSTTMELL